MILRQSLVLALFFLVSTSLCAAQSTPEFKSASEALTALDNMTECKCDTDVKAYRYFTSHIDESIPLLIDFTLTHKQRSFVSIRALSKIKDERVTTFLLNLADDEINNRNDSANDREGSYNKNHPYDKDGLVYQAVHTLVDLGDRRAVPLIHQALDRLYNPSRELYTEALCKLGEVSLDSVYEFHAKSGNDPMERMIYLAGSNVISNPEFSIVVFEWIISKSPEDKDLVNKCHLGMVMSYFNLNDYEKALEQCDFIRTQAEQGHVKAKDLNFVIDHQGYSLPQLEKLLKDKLEHRSYQ